MQASVASASSSSSSSGTSSSDKHASHDTPSLAALKTHYSLLGQRRRSRASSRLLSRVDDGSSTPVASFRGADNRFADRATDNERLRRRKRALSSQNRELESVAFNEMSMDGGGLEELDLDCEELAAKAMECGLTDGSDSFHQSESSENPDEMGVFRRDHPDLAGALESVFDQVGGNTNSIYKERSWTTDDIILRMDGDAGTRERLPLDAILGDEGVNYYQLLDKYVAHNFPHSDVSHLYSPLMNDVAFKSEMGAVTLAAAEERATNKFTTGQPAKSSENGPSKEQLIEVYNALRHELPLLLDKNLDYSMFSEKVVFVNNWQGHATTSVGLKPLIYRMALLRAICNLLFVRSEMKLLKIMVFEEESCVRVRWRIEGTGMLVKATSSQGFDGVATFRVDNVGKIARVEVERVLPDEERLQKKKNPMSLALAALIGGGILAPTAESVVAPATVLSATDGSLTDPKA